MGYYTFWFLYEGSEVRCAFVATRLSLATFQMFSSHTWLVTTRLDCTGLTGLISSQSGS